MRPNWDNVVVWLQNYHEGACELFQTEVREGAEGILNALFRQVKVFRKHRLGGGEGDVAGVSSDAHHGGP